MFPTFFFACDAFPSDKMCDSLHYVIKLLGTKTLHYNYILKKKQFARISVIPKYLNMTLPQGVKTTALRNTGSIKVITVKECMFI